MFRPPVISKIAEINGIADLMAAQLAVLHAASIFTRHRVLGLTDLWIMCASKIDFSISSGTPTPLSRLFRFFFFWTGIRSSTFGDRRNVGDVLREAE